MRRAGGVHLGGLFWSADVLLGCLDGIDGLMVLMQVALLFRCVFFSEPRFVLACAVCGALSGATCDGGLFIEDVR